MTAYEYFEPKELVITERLIFGANVTAAELPANLKGGYLYQVGINATDDDAVTFSIAAGNGSTLYTTTTTAATTGEVGQPTAYWWIYPEEAVTCTLSSFSGTGSVTALITVVKK